MLCTYSARKVIPNKIVNDWTPPVLQPCRDAALGLLRHWLSTDVRHVAEADDDVDPVGPVAVVVDGLRVEAEADLDEEERHDDAVHDSCRRHVDSLPRGAAETNSLGAYWRQTDR